MTTKFGVEIECVGFGGHPYRAQHMLTTDVSPVVCEHHNSHTVFDKWKVSLERSIPDGVEVISPPLPFTNEGLDNFGAMISRIQQANGHMDERCGMHVHVDASFLQNLSRFDIHNFFRYVINAYAANEHVFDSFVKPSRRAQNNTFCKSVKNKTFDEIYFDREHKVNIRSYDLYKTIEFRHYHGTLNSKAAQAWVQLIVTFLDNLKTNFFAIHPDLELAIA